MRPALAMALAVAVEITALARLCADPADMAALGAFLGAVVLFFAAYLPRTRRG